MGFGSKQYEERMEKLAKLYPELSREKLKEADRNLRAYIELNARIVERISKEPGGEEKLRKLLDENQDDQELGQGESPD